MISFRQFYYSLKKNEREEFAKKAKTTVSYISAHLVSKDPGKRKCPRKGTMKLFAKASKNLSSTEDSPTYDDLVDYFYREGISMK